jgi:5-methylcytosine-specific restriction protein A
VTPMLKRCIRCPRKFSGPGSRCPEHRISNWDKYQPAHREVYKSPQWVSLRRRVLREEPTCAEEGCQERSTSVDHIVPLADGGDPYGRSNVRGMCFFHHKRRTSQQGAERRKRQREQKGKL